MTETSLRAGTRDHRIATRLKQLRLDAGLTNTQAARKAGFSETKISRVERGVGSITPADLLTLLGAYGVGEQESQELVDLAHQTADRGIKGRPRTATTAMYRDDAADAACWGPALIPPPLRTHGYALAAARGVQDIMGLVPSQTRELAAAAGKWLDRLAARREPLVLQAVIDATALRRRVNGCLAETMAEQVRHLVWLAERPNVTLRVLPLDTRAPAGWAAFTLLRFDDPTLPVPDVAFQDDWGFGEFTATEQVTWRCRQQFMRLFGDAEPPGAALAAAAAHWSSGKVL
jgi:transcriptional regulator with XRE-family HTH domain